MHLEDDLPKFTKHLSKLISGQWSKIKNSSSNSQSDNIDQQLEEEYETLIREINYLNAEKSCYLSFLNDNFHNAKSSEELSTILNKHSSEVLKSYLKKHDKNVQSGTNRQELINYITEIFVARNKTCNNKLCSCKPNKVSKEVLTDNVTPEENGKNTQTINFPSKDAEKAIGRKPSYTQKTNQTPSDLGLKKDLVTVTVQTDYWNNDPFCKCGCCPKNQLQTDSKSMITDEKPVQNAATSDRKIMVSKNVLANCVGESIATSTSKRLCVPNNFENLLENKTNQEFPLCNERKDCACDAYDVREALKRGFVLPCSDICIQNKKVKIEESKKEKKKITKKNKMKTDYSDGNETMDTLSSAGGKKKKDNKNKKTDSESTITTPRKKAENKKKAGGKKKEDNKNKKTDSESTSTTPRKRAENKKRGIFDCFSRKKKKSRCDEHCWGTSEESRSVQTLPIRTKDQSEWACLCNKNNGKIAQTSTESEAATQISVRSSSDGFTKSKKDKDTEFREAFMQDRETLYRPDSENMRNKETSPKINDKYNRESLSRPGSPEYTDRHNKGRDNKDKNGEKLKDRVCSKCGRPKHKCVSGCRNTIIIPYGSSSSKALPASEVESLKMIIKMQSRDTNRQFDNIMTEINHQKSEVRRLNDMYQKMMENFYVMQKSPSGSRPQKEHSDLLCDCPCNNFPTSRKSDNAKECGCSFSNECTIMENRDTPTRRSYDAANNNSNSINSNQLKKFGPPNTAVAIHRCDCKVELAENSGRACFPTKEINYHDGDKRRKDQLNQSKKAVNSNQNLSTRKANIPSGGTGDSSLPQPDYISTLYKKDKKPQQSLTNIRNDQENVLGNNADHITENQEPENSKKKYVIDFETDNSEPEKKTRGIYSSRILLWLKKSWISIKHKREECRKKGEEEKENALKCMLKFCQNKTKQAATGIWKAAKSKTKVKVAH